MLDSRKLRMLAELERLGTIAAVAREFRQTAPGVSMQLGTLEREVGLQLTERQGRGLALTPAGVLLARHGREIVSLLTRAELDAAALRDGAAGRYRVAAFPSAARTIIAGAWRTVRESTESGLSLELVELESDDALAALANGEVELAVTHAYSNAATTSDEAFVTERIATERVFLASLEPGGPVELEKFANSDWIVPGRSLSCFQMVTRATGLAGFFPHAVAEATDFAVILALVSAGVGVALVPELTVASLPANVTLRQLERPVYRNDYVVTRSALDGDPGVRALRRILAEVAASLVEPISRGPGDSIGSSR
jgi:DNA-binding transcriptional LysR family regulator